MSSEPSAAAAASGGGNTFAGSKSMRVNYESGVDKYYMATGTEYRNPHMAGEWTRASSLVLMPM